MFKLPFTKPKPQSLPLELEKLEARKRKPMSQNQRLIVALQKAGPAGVPGWQLSRICPRYSTRFSEFRRDGYNILTLRDGAHFRYVLRGDDVK